MARPILASWRRLTGGTAVRDSDRRTLVALSGGADSTALLLALATQAPHVVAAHIVHDMRPPQDAEADRAVCERLCQALGVVCHARAISVRGGGNLEAAARRGRYRALADLAAETGCRFVATGHHAEDQLETLLMRILRGTGVRGMSGIHQRRRLSDSVTLVRPMLDARRADAERLCTDCGVSWRTDATNSDPALLRARLRQDVLPGLLAISPKAPFHAVSAATTCADAAAIVTAAADSMLERARISQAAWDRDALRTQAPGLLRAAVASMVRAGGGVVRRREVESVVRAIRSGDRAERRFEFQGCVVRVSGTIVAAAPSV